MNLKKLEKAAAMLKAVQTIDQEIIELERLAMLVANNEVKCSIDLNIEDMSKKAEKDNKVSFDEDGSLVNGGSLFEQIQNQYRIAFSWGGQCTSETKPKNQNSIKKDISENVTLQILGAMLYEKTAMREKLLSSLQKIGVAI